MRNLSMLTDLYQLTMMYGYHKHGMRDNIAVFDMFYRRAQENAGAYAIMAGLEQLMDYVEALCFTEEDIAYLRSLSLFDEDFLQTLKSLRFTGDIQAVPEGNMVFPGEPLIRVTAPIMEAQLIETALLNIINHQILIATKASRVALAAGSDVVMEFGLRRAQGPDAALYGARAAVIGGCQSTSNVMAGQLFDVPISGTHAHSWVMSFPDEISAFRAYAECFPDSCLLLVDTYNVLKSGVPNAITVFREMRQRGHEPRGIRLDSGDLAYLSRESRRMLDEAGFPDAIICASGDLDEYLIRELKQQGACVDLWGVGTRMITSYDSPALGGVYKMSAEIVNGKVSNKIKISENRAKITDPGVKKLIRIYDEQHMAVADLIALEEETFDSSQPLTIFDPVDTWKKLTLTNYTIREMHVPLFREGKRVYSSPSLEEISAYRQREMETFWEHYKFLLQPRHYKVDLSPRLWTLRQEMLEREY